VQNQVVFEFVRTNFFTRFPCHVCGGCTEKVGILCEVKDGPYKGWRVCEQCLKSGDVDERLQKNIKRVEEELQELRALAGNLVVPSYEQWLDECHAEDEKYLENERLEKEREEWEMLEQKVDQP
jgi:hypothetical protein